METLIYFVPLFGLAALLFSYVKQTWITKQNSGTERMVQISEYIREGAIAFTTSPLLLT